MGSSRGSTGSVKNVKSNHNDPHNNKTDTNLLQRLLHIIYRDHTSV